MPPRNYLRAAMLLVPARLATTFPTLAEEPRARILAACAKLASVLTDEPVSALPPEAGAERDPLTLRQFAAREALGSLFCAELTLSLTDFPLEEQDNLAGVLDMLVALLDEPETKVEVPAPMLLTDAIVALLGDHPFLPKTAIMANLPRHPKLEQYVDRALEQLIAAGRVATRLWTIAGSLAEVYMIPRPASAEPVAERVAAEAPPPNKIGLWRMAGIEGGKYLVLRRDGTVVEHPCFVLVARDPCAPAALMAYSVEAEARGLDLRYVRDVETLSAQFERYREAHGTGDPDAGPVRVDDPAIVARMAAGGSA